MMQGQGAQRPVLLRVLPDRLKLSLWARMYRGVHASRLSLYAAAPLRFAPDVTMELVPGDVISDSIAFTGIYELELTRRVTELARKGGTLLEVGANLGYFPLLWASAARGNRCIAVEPSPRNVALLQRNITRNRLNERIQLLPFAAGAAPGVVAFDPGPADQTGWGGLSAGGTEGAIDVEVVRLDETVPTSNPITLLKVDAEGSDAWVLKGCERLLRARTIREIWFEQNKPRMQALGIPLDAAQRYLRSLGYVPAAVGDTEADVVEWQATPAQ